MTTKELTKETKVLEKIIFNPKTNYEAGANVEVLRIDLEDDFTRIDFIYYAKPYYENGGWVQLRGDTFIKPVGSDLKLKLVKAINIPITPIKHFFKTTNDMLCYTLYFPAIPSGTKSIDIIEFDGNGENWFNLYDVSLEKVKSQVIQIGN